MLNYPYDLALQSLQPLVILDGEIYTKTRQPRRAGAELVTALGVVHPLRRLCSAKRFAAHHRRTNQETSQRLVQAELATRMHSGGYADTLRFFVDYLGPAFQLRDQGEDCLADAPPPSEVVDLNLTAEVVRIVEGLPAPRPPSPSFWLCGRVWTMQPTPPARGALQVRRDQETYGLANQHVLIRNLVSNWQQEVQSYLSRVIADLSERTPPQEPSEAVVKARSELASQGFVVRGDLLYLDGSPPRLGYLLPDHFNHVLGRHSHRDLAITAPLSMPPRITGPSVFRRSTQGWERYRPPNGLCLGGSAPSPRPESPGVALAAYLRWAAQRLAANGRFHSGDGIGEDIDLF
jgi:hypothetical protein